VTEIEANWHIRQRYALGESLHGFFQRLRRRKQVYGRRCDTCSLTHCPPRDFCSRCLGKCGAWVPVGPDGELRALTVIGAAFDGFPEPPYAIAFVQLDKADTSVLGYLTGRDWSAAADWSRLIGQRCRAVVRDDADGSWNDLSFALSAPRQMPR